MTTNPPIHEHRINLTKQWQCSLAGQKEHKIDLDRIEKQRFPLHLIRRFNKPTGIATGTQLLIEIINIKLEEIKLNDEAIQHTGECSKNASTITQFNVSKRLNSSNQIAMELSHKQQVVGRPEIKLLIRSAQE